MMKKLSDSAVLLTTHRMDEAEQLCDNIILLNKGEIVANDTIDQLMSQTESKSLTELFLSLTGGALREPQGTSNFSNIDG